MTPISAIFSNNVSPSWNAYNNKKATYHSSPAIKSISSVTSGTTAAATAAQITVPSMMRTCTLMATIASFKMKSKENSIETIRENREIAKRRMRRIWMKKEWIKLKIWMIWKEWRRTRSMRKKISTLTGS